MRRAPIIFVLMLAIPAFSQSQKEKEETASGIATLYKMGTDTAIKLYEGKTLVFSGKVERIEKDWRDRPVVTFETYEKVIRFQATFPSDQTAKLADVMPSMTIKARCTILGHLTFMIVANKCEVVMQ